MKNKKTPFKFNKNSMVNYVKMMRKELDDKAFTLIELIVVMAILAILVLLAAPQFLGYTEKAKIAQIQNDTAVVEAMVAEGLVLDKLEFDSDSFGETLILSDSDESKVYNKSGLVKTGITPSDYKEVPPHLVDKTRTQLDEKGTFYSDKDGNIIFVIDGGSAGSEDGQPDDEFSDGGGNQNPDDSGNEVEDPSDGSDNEEVDYGGYDELGVDGVAWVNEMIDQGFVMGSLNEFSYFAPHQDGDGFYYWDYTDDYANKDGYWEYDRNHQSNHQKVIIPLRLDGQLITSYRTMFYGKSVDSVASNNPYVTNMAFMFQHSSSLTSDKLDLSNFDTSNVTSMEGMFWNSGMTELDLSGFNTSNVTDMSNMFFGSSVTELNLSGFDTRNVTDMSYMFTDSSVTELDLSGFDIGNAANVEGMFAANVEGMFGGSTIKMVAVSTQEIVDKFRNESWAPGDTEFTIINN